MADRLEALFFGLFNALTATGIGIAVGAGELPTGWIYLAAVCAFTAVAFAAKLGFLSAKGGEGR